MLTNEDTSNSIVLISSQDSSNSQFGTGFIIGQSNHEAYVLTCAHVVRDVGGPEQIDVDGFSTTVVAAGDVDSLDLAVLRIEGLWDRESLHLKTCGSKGRKFRTAGFRAFSNDRIVRTIHGKLGEQVGLQYKKSGERVQAWDLHIDEEHTIERGYSGSPVFDPETGNVIAVISHREGVHKGLAICISSLSKIWKALDSEQLFRILLTLGYHKHDRLFRQLPLNQAVVAAFLIHGPHEYCPQWLLNRLLVRHISSFASNSKVVKTHLHRRTRGISVEALWRELGSRVGIPKDRSPTVIAERILQWWKTQDVILIIHDVNCLPKTEVYRLINEFWSVLIKKTGELSGQTHKNKLLMFLVDYEDDFSDLGTLFEKRIGNNWQPNIPVIFPNLTKFSETDLLTWIDYEFDNLPKGLKDISGESIQDLLTMSDDGIPEFTLEALCLRCGCNWYEESEEWLKKVS